MSFSPEVATRSSARSFRPEPGPVSRCAVCHATDVIRDEVFDGGTLQLCECRRCEHRWTFRPLATSVAAARVPRTVTRRRIGAAARRAGVASAA